MPTDVGWIVWLQSAVLFILYFTPGNQSDAYPVYVSQVFLLFAIQLKAASDVQKTAAYCLILAAGASVVSAYASAVNVTAVYSVFAAGVHLGVMSAVAILLFVSSRHILATL